MRLETLRALSYLTPNQREALVDRVLLDRLPGEIASDMGCTESNVFQLIQHAKAHLALTLRKD